MGSRTLKIPIGVRATESIVGTVDDLRQLAQAHSDAGDRLQALIDEVDAATRRAFEERRERLEECAELVDETRERLRAGVTAHAGLFRSPRTMLHAGIEFGMAKSPDGCTVKPETAALIREHHPDLASKLLRDSVVKPEAKKLPVNIRRQIGVQVTRGKDAPFVRRVRDGLDASWTRLLGMVTPS